MKKTLLAIGVLSGLMTANIGFAAAPQGTAATITTAKIICTGSLTGDVPLATVTGAAQQKGMESSWFITNTSDTKSLAITQVESYGMDGQLLVRSTPKSNPDLNKETGGFFDWTVKPHQVVRFPHDNSMIYPAKGVAGTSPELVRWFNVVFTVKSATAGSISAPIANTGSVERTEDLTVTPATHFVLSRTRNECKYMM